MPTPASPTTATAPPAPVRAALERREEPLQVRLAPHERREPARGEGLGAGLRGGGARHLVHLDGRVQPLARAPGPAARVATRPRGQRDGVAGGEDGAGLGHLLHPRGQVHGRPHRGVGHGQVVLDGAHHHLARVQPHADLKRHARRVRRMRSPKAPIRSCMRRAA